MEAMYSSGEAPYMVDEFLLLLPSEWQCAVEKSAFCRTR